MKITKQLNDEQLIARLRELSGTIKESTNNVVETSKLLYQVKSPDFNRYAIVNEGKAFYIKGSSIQSKEVLTESDFTYIGGLGNKTKFKFSSYSDALKNLNMMIKDTLSEGYYHSYTADDEANKEFSIDEVEQEYQEQPAPEQEYQEQPQGEPAPEQAPAPAPQGDYDPELEGPESDSTENVDHYLGKLTYLIQNTPEEELSDVKIKAILNSVVSSLPLDRVAPEERLELAKRVKNGSDNEDSDGEGAPSPEGEQQPAPQAEPQGAPSPEQEYQEQPQDDETELEEGLLNMVGLSKGNDEDNKIISQLINNIRSGKIYAGVEETYDGKKYVNIAGGKHLHFTFGGKLEISGVEYDVSGSIFKDMKKLFKELLVKKKNNSKSEMNKDINSDDELTEGLESVSLPEWMKNALIHGNFDGLDPRQLQQVQNVLANAKEAGEKYELSSNEVRSGNPDTMSFNIKKDDELNHLQESINKITSNILKGLKNL